MLQGLKVVELATYIAAPGAAAMLADWGADLLCRLCTGEGDAKRRLYTDDDTVVVELKRAILLNAINVPSDRADVLDRTLALELVQSDRFRRK